MIFRLSIAAGLLCLLISAGVSPSLAADKDAVKRPDLTIFFSSDTRGMLRRCGCSEGQMGGLSARAGYIKKNKVMGRTLVLDAGDTLFDGLTVPDEKREFYALKARTMLKAMYKSGCDTSAVGEYDLACGSDFLAAAANSANLQLLAANLAVDKDGYLYKPFSGHVIKRLVGVRVGIIGVLDPAFPYKDFPSLAGVKVSDPVAAVNEEIKKMGGKADVVVVLAHMSITPVEKFAASLSGVDIVVQGHSQDMLEAPIKAGGALVVKGFYRGKHIGRLDLQLNNADRSKGNKVADVKYTAVALDESVPNDRGVDSILAKYRVSLKNMLFVFAEPDPDGAGKYTGPDSCYHCHRVAYRNWTATAHDKALSSLVQTKDQYDPECLPCHVTGYGYASGYSVKSKGPGLDRVTCESCHGRRSEHIKAVRSGQGGSAVDKIAPMVSEATCRGCHDEEQSPHFDFEKYKELGGAHRSHPALQGEGGK